VTGAPITTSVVTGRHGQAHAPTFELSVAFGGEVAICGWPPTAAAAPTPVSRRRGPRNVDPTTTLHCERYLVTSGHMREFRRFYHEALHPASTAANRNPENVENFAIFIVYRPGVNPSANSAAIKIPQIATHSPSDSSKISRIDCPSLSRDIGSPFHRDDGDDNPGLSL